MKQRCSKMLVTKNTNRKSDRKVIRNWNFIHIVFMCIYACGSKLNCANWYACVYFYICTYIYIYLYMYIYVYVYMFICRRCCLLNHWFVFHYFWSKSRLPRKSAVTGLQYTFIFQRVLFSANQGLGEFLWNSLFFWEMGNYVICFERARD